MKEKRVSFGQGKGSITHNNRKFIAENVDVFRTHENITFVQQSIKDAYEQLFAESTERYNTRQKRNPNFYFFNAVLHMDEVTPYLHIDYIPVWHYRHVQNTQNGIAQALKEMGFGEGKQAIARWRAAEVEVLNAIYLEHGIKPLAPEKFRGTLEVAEYKEQRRKKAKAFISACGLSDDFARYKFTKTRSSELE